MEAHQDSVSAESTVDEAWRLLRCAWHAKRAGNEAWGHGGHGGHSVEEAVRNYTAGLRSAARAERFVDLEALEDTVPRCSPRFGEGQLLVVSDTSPHIVIERGVPVAGSYLLTFCGQVSNKSR